MRGPSTRRLCPACGSRTLALICPDDGTATLDVPEQGLREDPYLGRVIDDRYRIVGLLGEGGMGRVYSAVQLVLGQQVAIKVLLPDRESNETSVKRFHREAKATTRLHNPHVVRVYDFGIDVATGSPYLVMEYLRGRTVHDLLRTQGPMSLKRALGITAQVVRALVEAEDQSLVHRDIKPENLFLVETGDETDFVKVMDFGVARTVSGVEGGLSSITNGGNVVGTPAYMSPEQVSGYPTTTRSDLYSVGCLLHELVCAERPYADSGDSIALMVAHVTRPPPVLPPATPNGETIPSAVRLIHAALLRKSPLERPRSARLALAALQAVLEGRHDDVATILELKVSDAAAPAEPEPASEARPAEIAVSAVSEASLAEPPALPAAPRGRRLLALGLGGLVVGLATLTLWLWPGAQGQTPVPDAVSAQPIRVSPPVDTPAAPSRVAVTPASVTSPSGAPGLPAAGPVPVAVAAPAAAATQPSALDAREPEPEVSPAGRHGPEVGSALPALPSRRPASRPPRVGPVTRPLAAPEPAKAPPPTEAPSNLQPW